MPEKNLQSFLRHLQSCDDFFRSWRDFSGAATTSREPTGLLQSFLRHLQSCAVFWRCRHYFSGAATTSRELRRLLQMLARLLWRYAVLARIESRPKSLVPCIFAAHCQEETSCAVSSRCCSRPLPSQVARPLIKSAGPRAS